MNAGEKRWGHHEDRRDWVEYNERLVKRGEMYLSLGFLESWAKDLETMNAGKVGAPYKYPGPFMMFLGFTHIVFGIDYRGLEGFTRGLTMLAPRTRAGLLHHLQAGERPQTGDNGDAAGSRGRRRGDIPRQLQGEGLELGRVDARGVESASGLGQGPPSGGRGRKAVRGHHGDG